MAKGDPRSLAVILGSAFEQPELCGVALSPHTVETPFGPAALHRHPAPRADGRATWVLFRHGAPHRYLPNQIPYRAQAHALWQLGCGALLVTSSVGVLDPALPLDRPLLLSDLVMLDNRLPDGSACTIFPEPRPVQWHLVLDEGLFSRALGEQVADICAGAGAPLAGEALFGYAGGPRTKTAAENRLFAAFGLQVNSMTVAPEVVLAGELGIPCAALVMGHKYSRPGVRERLDRPTMDQTLQTARVGLGELAARFLAEAEPVPFKNRRYRYGDPDLGDGGAAEPEPEPGDG